MRQHRFENVTGGPHLLVVDDDPNIRTALSGLLALHGFSVSLADNANTALEQFEKGKGEFSLVLVDYCMPGQNGVALSKALRHLSCDLPIVLMSGCVESAGSSAERDSLFDACVSKPFDIEALVDLLRCLTGRMAVAHQTAQ